MPSNTETLQGKIENVVYRNELNEYSVLEVSLDSGEIITAVGHIPSPGEGEIVVLAGEWTHHKEFGRQFSFTEYEKRMPADIDGIIQYLSSRTVKGIGPVTALKIVNKFGLDTFDVIEHHPEWLVDIPGITQKRALAISKSFSEQAEFRNVMMFFGDHLSAAETTRIYKRFGASALGTVRDDPYTLCRGEFRISFDKADSIAKSLGFAPDCDGRILAGIEYVLDSNAASGGHTCLPEEKTVSETVQLLGISEDRVEEAIASFVKNGRLVRFTYDGSIFIMRTVYDRAEARIADGINRLVDGTVGYSVPDISALIDTVENQMGIRYAQMQREALFSALRYGASIITGGPGTGKTTIIRALIAIFKSMGLKTALAAPTGRAAKRMSEATLYEAKTVHRMLEMERSEGDEIIFNRNARSPLEEKVIIIDEASMMDVHLTEALILACPRGARLILIGDSDQLPSVGAGNVLADLISSGKIPTVCLSEIFRQSKESLIVTNAHLINNGEAPRLNATDNDFFFVRRQWEREIPDTIAELIISRLPKAYGEDIKDKIQVITPSRKGVGGVERLNAVLQERINPPAKFKKECRAHGVVFREGDRVMQTVNNYDVEWEKNGIAGYGIFNGDIGIIEEINTVEEKLVIRFDDRVVDYGYELLDELELSYAITVHKSQGSEYPVVIMPMYSCPPMLMTRNLLYTAVTRARSMVILVGGADIPSKMVSNNSEILRYTTLKYRIK